MKTTNTTATAEKLAIGLWSMQIRHAVLAGLAIDSGTCRPSTLCFTSVPIDVAYWRTGVSADSITSTIVVTASADSDHSISVRNRETPFLMTCTATGQDAFRVSGSR
jgi:hypothetical protein